jgi:hypothetical protein
MGRAVRPNPGTGHRSEAIHHHADHVTGGRAVLGIGGAWFEREHEAFGVPEWGTGERIGEVDALLASG